MVDVADSGHNLHHDQPGLTARIIEDFLRPGSLNAVNADLHFVLHRFRTAPWRPRPWFAVRTLTGRSARPHRSRRTPRSAEAATAVSLGLRFVPGVEVCRCRG